LIPHTIVAVQTNTVNVAKGFIAAACCCGRSSISRRTDGCAIRVILFMGIKFQKLVQVGFGVARRQLLWTFFVCHASLGQSRSYTAAGPLMTTNQLIGKEQQQLFKLCDLSARTGA